MEGLVTKATFWLDNYRKFHDDVIISNDSTIHIQEYFNFVEYQNDLTPTVCGHVCVTSKHFHVNFTQSIVIGVNDFLFNEISESEFRYFEVDSKKSQSTNYHFIIDICLIIFAIFLYTCSLCFKKRYYTIKESDTLEQCSICLEQFKLFEKVEKTQCNHLFHVECIEEWNEINRTCPLCKHEIKIF